MKNIILLLLLVIPVFSFCQDYPKYEIDTNGIKLVVFTIEQARKIDNDYDLLLLLENFRIKCDSLGISYIKVINEQNNQILLLKKINLENEKKITDKDGQINVLTKENINLEKNIKLCDEQKGNNQKEIDGLKSDIIKMKWKSLGSGFLIGVVTTLVTILLKP